MFCIPALVSSGLGLWNISAVGTGRPYLTAAARSMSLDWSNWFFVSFDPGGFLTVEKPPLPLWIQSLLVRWWGVSQPSILLPSLTAAAIACTTLAVLLRRYLPTSLAIAAGTALAVTPGMVALSRSNYADIFVIMLCVAAAALTMRAIHTARVLPLLAAAACMALGFLSKMLYAYQVLPALVLAYLIGAPHGLRRRLTDLILAGAVMLVGSFWWPIVVDLVASDRRPWVAHTTSNSVMEQVFGWNSLNGPPQPPGPPPGWAGPSGWFRVFGPAGDQAYWLLPLALAGIVVAVRAFRRGDPARTAFVTLCAAWSVSTIAVFSFTGRVVHDYYATLAAPPLIALAALALDDFFDSARARTLTMLATIATLVLSAWFLIRFDASRAALVGVVGVAITIALLAVLLCMNQTRRSVPLLTAVLLALSVAPAAWSVAGAYNPPWDWNPVARPEQLTQPSPRFSQELLDFAQTRRDGERWIFAVPTYGYAEDAITRGYDVLAGGGFNDAPSTSFGLERVQGLVATGALRFILDGTVNQYDPRVSEWIGRTCPVVFKDPTTTSLVLRDCNPRSSVFRSAS